MRGVIPMGWLAFVLSMAVSLAATSALSQWSILLDGVIY